MKRVSKALVVTGLTLILFSILTVWVKYGEPVAFNRAAEHAISSFLDPTLTALAIGMDYLGEWYVYLLLAVGLLIYPKTRRTIGVPTVGAVLVAGGLVPLLKRWLAVPRPTGHWLLQATGYGLPSGHTTMTAAFITVLIFGIWQSRWSRPLKILVSVVLVGWLLLMGLSRVYLGVHNLTDVLGGCLVGVGIASLVIFFYCVVCGKIIRSVGAWRSW